MPEKVFSPVDFIGRFGELDKFLKDFNQYLAFDKWKIVRNGAEINFIRLDQIEFDESTPAPNEDEFLKREFEEVALENIGLDEIITEVLRLRVVEIEKCLSNDAPLSVIFLAGSTLEGVLLGIALSTPKNSISQNHRQKIRKEK